MFPKTGNVLPARGNGPCDARIYAATIGAALRDELGDTRRATKSLMQWTGANERTVKNWLGGSSGPSGSHLVDIMRHSSGALAAVLVMSGREQSLAIHKLAAAREVLIAMLEVIVDLTSER
jgi:pyocin large subunit-like protein